MGAGIDLHSQGSLLRWNDKEARARQRYSRRAGAGGAGRLSHTDHISPAGNIKANGPAGKYLAEHGVKPAEFNSYGSRRGNHEVMVRGTFANVRLRNKLAPGTEGGVTRLLPEGEGMSIFDASVQYAERGVPLIILAARNTAPAARATGPPKGQSCWGVRAVIAESFERIHRSNLVGMGILPLQYRDGENAEVIGLTGEEIYHFPGLAALLDSGFANGRVLRAFADSTEGLGCSSGPEFDVTVRIDTPQESSTSSTAASCSMCCASWCEEVAG